MFLERHKRLTGQPLLHRLLWGEAAAAASSEPIPLCEDRLFYRCQYNSEASGIGGVLKDGQIGFVVKNLIEDIGGIADGGGDDFGAIL